MSTLFAPDPFMALVTQPNSLLEVLTPATVQVRLYVPLIEF